MKIDQLNLMKLVISGSRAYKINTEKSDYEYRGIYIGKKEDYLGLVSPTKTYRKFPEDSIWLDKNGKSHDLTQDTSIYEFRHFIHMCINCNPTIVEILTFKNIAISNRHTVIFFEELLKLVLSKSLVNNTMRYSKTLYQTPKDLAVPKNDLKNRANALRLIYTIEDFLISGQYKPIRPDFQLTFLRQVREGSVSNTRFNDVYRVVEKCCFDLTKDANLPNRPNNQFVNELLVDYLKSYLF